MLTIGEVFGIPTKKKSGIKRDSSSRNNSLVNINLQARGHKKSNTESKKLTQTKKSSKKDSNKKRKRSSKINLNRSFTKRTRRSNRKDKHRVGSLTRAVTSRDLDPSDKIFSQKYYMTDLEHYLNAPINNYYSKLFEEHLKENMGLIKYTTSEYNLSEPKYKIKFKFPAGKFPFLTF